MQSVVAQEKALVAPMTLLSDKRNPHFKKNVTL
jgi:hypothetical protein